jgi:hypothetical protein
MDTIGWGILLLVLKWVFIGLVYLILAVVLLAVRRELSTRVQDNSESERAAGQAESCAARGRQPLDRGQPDQP